MNNQKGSTLYEMVVMLVIAAMFVGWCFVAAWVYHVANHFIHKYW